MIKAQEIALEPKARSPLDMTRKTASSKKMWKSRRLSGSSNN
jgi:hypothetical protein